MTLMSYVEPPKMPGPCAKCGVKNYRLSSHPELCPDCSRTLDREQKAKERAAANAMGLHNLPFDDQRVSFGLIGQGPIAPPRKP